MCVAILYVFPKSVSAETSPVVAEAPPAAVAVVSAAVVAPEPKPSREKEEAYVLKAMTTWAPASTMPGRDIGHYPSIAHDIVETVFGSDEVPLWKDDTSKLKTLTLLAAIGFWEGRFHKHVDDGTCNDRAKRKELKVRALLAISGDCDGGWAFSIFQIHPEGGIVLTSDGGWQHAWDTAGAVGIDGRLMIEDRKLAAKVALHMLRKSIQLSGGLCGYSGEPGPCPKAEQRLRFALGYASKHSY